MIRALLTSSAAAALLVATAAAGTPGMSPSATGTAWQLAQAQPMQDAQPPAAGEPAAPPADQPAATDQPPVTGQPAPDTAETPSADQPVDQTAQEPAAPDQPADTAQQPPAGDQQDLTAETAETMDTAVFITEQAQTHWLATDYIGDRIYNRQDEQIGSVDDLIVEEDGGLVGFVVGVGGFLGIGKKQVAINLDAVEIQQDEAGRPKLVVAGSREALMDAPDFVDKSAQQAEVERREREMQAQQPPTGGAPGGMGGAPGGAPGGMGGAPGGPPGQ